MTKATIRLSDHHPFVTSGKDISAICEPVLSSLNINMFVYGRYYHDGQNILLANSDRWVNHHLTQGYLVPAPVPANLLALKNAYHMVPSAGQFSQAKDDLIKYFHTNYAVDFISTHKDYIEVACFSFHKNCHDAMTIMLNNLDRLNGFVAHFRGAAKNIVNAAEKHKISLPESMAGIRRNQVSKKIPNRALEVNDHLVTISPSQFNVVKQLLRGKTYKTIAKDLNLSPRTVEYYVEILKNKTNTSSKQELISSFLNSSMMNDAMFN